MSWNRFQPPACGEPPALPAPPAPGAEHHPEVSVFLHGHSARRRRTLTDLIRTGIDSGELPSHLDPELAALALAGPVVYCRTMTADPLPVSLSRQLALQVLGPPA